MKHFIVVLILQTLIFGIAPLRAELNPSQETDPDAGKNALTKKASEEKYTLAKLVEIALEHTQILGSQDARVKQARFSALQARTWPGPSLEFSSGKKKEAQLGGARRELVFAQPLPLLGKLNLQGEILDLESESWRVRRVQSEIAVTLNVAQIAYEYALNRQKANFVEKRRKRFELIQAYLAGRVFATPQKKAESHIVQNHLKSLASEAIQSQAGFKAAFQKLKAYVPLDSQKYPDIDAPFFSGSKTLDEKEWFPKALQNNPDLRLQKLVVQGAQLEKTLARRDGLPDPSLTASYEESKTQETEKNYGLGLSLALPPWNRNRSGVRSAEQKKLAEDKQLAFEEQKLRAVISQILVEYEAARLIVQQYPQAILPSLEAQLEEAEEGFRKGQLNLLTFLELDDSADETYERALDAQLNLAIKVAEILNAAGEQGALALFGSF